MLSALRGLLRALLFLIGLSRNRSPPDYFVRLGRDDGIELRQAESNIFISGQVGSGKTTGPMAHVAHALLKRGIGGLVICAKQDEAARWLRYCEQTGRSVDVIHVTVDGPYVLDLIAYEMASEGGSEESAIQLLQTILEAANKKESTSSDSYFIEQSLRLLRYGMLLMKMNGLPVSLISLQEFCASLPSSRNELEDDEFAANSGALLCLKDAKARYEKTRAYQNVKAFIEQEWVTLGDRTRAGVLSQSLVTIDRMVSGPFARLISAGAITFTPEDALERGKIILLDVPYTTYFEPARWMAIGVKYVFQRACFRRPLTDDAKPVFLAIDECQHYVTAEDVMVLSTSRQYRMISVNATQNLPLLYTAFGGDEAAKNRAAAWQANHAVTFTAGNTCRETCEFYSKAYGESRQSFFSGDVGYQYNPWDRRWNLDEQRKRLNWSQQVRVDVAPEQFSQLLRGGPPSWTVESYVQVTGHVFNATGKNYMRCALPQIL